MTKEELILVIRLDIANELEAIYIYYACVRAMDDVRAQKVISDIRDEERAHVGELMSLLMDLEARELEQFASGEVEVKEMPNELSKPKP